jgi:hypothetical protein
MVCGQKVADNIKKLFDERESKSLLDRQLEFFLDSMSDETYLDMIRKKIEFLIDEGYKFSEQLEIINHESGRGIEYSTYTNFVKLNVLQQPEKLFQSRGDEREINEPELKKHLKRDKQTQFEDISENSIQKTPKSITPPETTISVEPLKKPERKVVERKRVGFTHEAMPNVEELY